MSSAILYVAIVAIWACVLIPRWLRRDFARGAGHADPAATADDVVRGDVVSGEDATEGDVRLGLEDVPATTVHVRYAESLQTDLTVQAAPRVPGAPTAPAPPAAAPPAAAPRAAAPPAVAAQVAAAQAAPAAAASPAEAPGDVPRPAAEDRRPRQGAPEETRRRMLTARRRLLGMLSLLEIAAIALAFLGLAALWVLIPPSVMLLGYLLLLREAAHADAERTQRARDAAGARAKAHAGARQRAARHAVTAPAARYEGAGPGRDFAPGLAGRYTTSNAAVINLSERADDDVLDEYRARELRAVGD